MKVFVTGGNGFIGSRVCKRLVAEGHTLRLNLRKSSNTDRLEGLEYETHIGDVRDAESMRQGAEGCDAIIHLASLSAWEQIRSPLMREIVVDGTRNVCEAAKANGGQRVVFVSSVTAIGGTKEPVVQDETAAFSLPAEPFVYAHAKRDAEAICREYALEHGVGAVTVCPCEVYGPEDHDFITASYLRDAIKDWPAMAVNGGTAVAHVDDIAGGIVAALEKGRPGERYILGGDNVHARDIIKLTLAAAGKEGKFILQLPNGLTLWAIQTMARLGLPTPVHPDLMAHAVHFFYVDSSKAVDELGYTWTPAPQVIEDVVGWLKSAGHV